MPQLALAAQAFTTAGTAASISTATAAVAKATLMTTLKSVAMNVLTNVAISAAMTALQPQVGAAGRTFEWTLDPDGPIPFAAGRIGVPGSAVYRKTFGPDLMYYGIPSVLSGAGPIDGFESVQADDETVTFNANGMAITSQYANELWYRNRLGTQPDTALVSPTGLKKGASLPGWTSAHKLSGKASYLLVMGENSKGTAYPTGEVKPIITFRGLKGWDPRLDSTYPGGAGACRLSNPSTWVYITNPILWALKWALGLWEGPTGKGAPQVDYQVGGIGAKLSGIDVPAFVAAANVADANAWTVGAYPTTDDDKGQVLDAFLQAGGAIYAQRAGKISCIQRASIRASIVTISAADTAGPLEIDTAASRIDRINTIRPRFWSEAHRWQMKAIDEEVTDPSYQAEDGAKRTRGIDYPYVTNAKQAAQLAALQIANTREGIAGVIPLKPHLQRIRPGDAFTITEPGFVLNGVKCLCLTTDYDPATGVVRVSFVSETDGKYAFAMGQNPTPPSPPVLTPVDPTYVSPPEIDDWTIVVRPPSPGGGQLPGFDLGGIVSNDTATAIIVEHGPSAAGPWTQAYQGPPTVTKIPVDGLQPGATYYVAVQYQRNQNYSARQVYGPYTAPLLDPSPTAPTVLGLQAQITAAFGDIFDVSELVADARADIDAHGVEIAAARGGQPDLNARIVQVNQARIDGDGANALAITNLTARAANTEADIIDIENAQATDRTATAQAINQLSARSDSSINQNPKFSAWTDTLPVGWQAESPANGTYAKVAGLNGSANSLRTASVGAGGFGFWQRQAGAVDGQYLVLEADFTLVSGDLRGAGVLIRMRNAANTQVGANQLVRFGYDNDASGRLVGAGVAGGRYAFAVVIDARAAGATQYDLFGLVRSSLMGGVVGAASLDWHKLSIRPANAEEVASRTVLPALQASSTEHSLAIIDLENQQAIAAYEVLSNASGGLPAFLRLISATGGGYAALAAPVVALMNTVLGGAPLVAMEARGGEVFFPRPVYVDLGGRRLILGPGNGWVLWFGPDTISAASATRTNGYFALGTDGKVYYGTGELAGGSGSVPTVNVTAPSSSNATTNVTAVSSAKTVPASPRVKASFGYSYDGGSIMSGVGSSTFVVEFFEQQGATINVLETTTMTVLGTTTSVTDVTGGAVSNFPTGKNGTLTGAVTYGVRHRRTSGSLNFTNLRCTLYAEITGQT